MASLPAPSGGHSQVSRTQSYSKVLSSSSSSATTHSGLWPDSCCTSRPGYRACLRIPTLLNGPRRDRSQRPRSPPRSGRTGRRRARLLSVLCWCDLPVPEEQRATNKQTHTHNAMMTQRIQGSKRALGAHQPSQTHNHFTCHLVVGHIQFHLL